ncbi:MAG: ThuA domain-containing protein [Planctomycetota bacterium]|jgi:type 1 glutamine amidotransferase
MFPNRIFFIVKLFCSAIVPVTLTACNASTRNLETVLWIGGFAHDFEAGAKILTDDVIGKLTSEEIKIVRDGAFLESPQARDLDVIVMHHCFKSAKGVMTPKQKQRLLGLVRGGVDVVAIHASYYSFPEWDGVRELYGAKFIKHGKTDAIVQVRTVDGQHPIMKDLEKVFEVKSELYESTPLADDCHVLARAREKGKDAEHPSVWTRKYGKGRVVTILPAHWAESFKVVGFQKLISNSILWAAGRLN